MSSGIQRPQLPPISTLIVVTPRSDKSGGKRRAVDSVHRRPYVGLRYRRWLHLRRRLWARAVTSSMVAAWMPFHESHRFGALAALACAALTDLSDRLSDLNRFIVLPLCGCSLLCLRPQRHIRIRDAYWMRARRTLTCLAKCLMWSSPTLTTPSRLRWYASVSPPWTTRVRRQPRSLSGTGYHHLNLARYSDMLLASLGPPLYDHAPYRTDVCPRRAWIRWCCLLDYRSIGNIACRAPSSDPPLHPLVLAPRRELLPLDGLVYPPRADTPVLSTARHHCLSLGFPLQPDPASSPPPSPTDPWAHTTARSPCFASITIVPISPQAIDYCSPGPQIGCRSHLHHRHHHYHYQPPLPLPPSSSSRLCSSTAFSLLEPSSLSNALLVSHLEPGTPSIPAIYKPRKSPL
ncbi:hypothetical protein DFH08DRAFT_951368 [Mycena albidolilacea]|uniref:Uncharacterized protein n=1 Tax=Mycena albidolilacea TaxID=1033008 RepID=A0AAD7AJX0_9AGAR|nr:hypothetical protein DFH08DRAFT_951368 [Mycena albidolilacea]